MTKEFTPYNDEWKKDMMKTTKPFIIDMLKKAKLEFMDLQIEHLALLKRVETLKTQLEFATYEPDDMITYAEMKFKLEALKKKVDNAETITMYKKDNILHEYPARSASSKDFRQPVQVALIELDG